MNVIVWLEFKFAYYDVAVQHVSYYAMGTLPLAQGTHLVKSLQLYTILFILIIGKKDKPSVSHLFSLKIKKLDSGKSDAVILKGQKIFN